MKFNFRSTVGWSEVNKTPEVQTRWREGRAGEIVSFEDPEAETGFQLCSRIQFLGFWTLGPEYAPGEPIYDNFNELFRKGFTSSNAFNVSGGGTGYTYFSSVSRIDDRGIVPNTFF